MSMWTPSLRVFSVQLVLLLLYCFHHTEAGGPLDFIYPPTFQLVPIGDDTFGIYTSTDGGFRFGNGSVQGVYVSTNGYISMGLTPTANAQSVAGANSIIAPYGADIDTQVAGSVKYTRFYSDYSDLDDVSDFIEDEMNVDFNGEKMMVAEWNNVAEYNGDPLITSTFQAVLITDNTVSYAVFVYLCGGMEWGGAEIGWQASKSHAERHSLSGKTSAQIGCEYSSDTSAVVFRVSNCKSDEYTCDDGECVRRDKFCNWESDCQDGSDEAKDCFTFLDLLITVFTGFAVLTITVIVVVSMCYVCKKRRQRTIISTRPVTNHTNVAIRATDMTTAPHLNQETSFSNLFPYNGTQAQQKALEKEAEFNSQDAPPPYDASTAFQALSPEPNQGYSHYTPTPVAAYPPQPSAPYPVQNQALQMQMPYPSAPTPQTQVDPQVAPQDDEKPVRFFRTTQL